MTEDEAADVSALVDEATPVDIYGAWWGSVLALVDPQVLVVSGTPTVTLPDGIPDVE